MLTVTCTTCSHCCFFDVTDVGGIAECPRCGTHQHLVPDQVRAVCEFLKHTHLSYCKLLREHFDEEKPPFQEKRAWEATMSFETGVYVYWWLVFVLEDCEQPPLTSALVSKLAQDTILLNTTPQSAVTRRQIAQLRDVIEDRPYQIVKLRGAGEHRAQRSEPPAASRQLADHLSKAMEYRFHKYTTCLHKGETYGHVAACCFSHLYMFLNECSCVAKDDLSKISMEDGPMHLCGNAFDMSLLRGQLGTLEQFIVIPYRCVLQTLFESTDDLLTLDPNETLTIIGKTWTDAQAKLAGTDKDCVKG